MGLSVILITRSISVQFHLTFIRTQLLQVELMKTWLLVIFIMRPILGVTAPRMTVDARGPLTHQKCCTFHVIHFM